LFLNLENSRQNGSSAYSKSNTLLWEILFFSILAIYCWLHAPYGINETDGGFLTGLAWQVLNGKALFGDVIYVRPPLPVWLRAGELFWLPDQFAVLGERWIFYFKVALYSWLGAATLTSGAHRWMLATFSFVISAHCYPPMAWHTVDGILFSALGIWLLARVPNWWGTALAGVCIFAALLCKQSFYPMAFVFAVILILDKNRSRAVWGIGSFFLCTALFFSYLQSKDLLENYLKMTGASASGGQALQHGILDYFRIKPVVALLSIPILVPVIMHFWKKKNLLLAAWAWALWLVMLAASYAFDVWQRQEFTSPFAQARLLFWGAAMFVTTSLRHCVIGNPMLTPFIVYLSSLLAVSWCAAISWGYNLPILFAVPGIFAAMEISRRLWRQVYPNLNLNWLNLCALILLLAVFRYAYEFVYRDGQRGEMVTPMGEVFPQLTGIYSTSEKGQFYLELKNLAAEYPNFKTLPAFPQANFLTKTRPPLPLDWVVNRETNGDNTLILKNLQENKPTLFIEKKYADKIPNDPELSLTRDLLRTGTIVDETPHFWVVQLE
jgi:hypothetical protein